jgi:uncharacterized membrane protein
MAPIVNTVEIARTPEDVFAYIGELERHGEWQEAIQEVELLTEKPTRVGSRAAELRRVPGGPRRFTYEMTEFDAPRRAAFKGLDGPVRPVGTVTVEPLDGGARSRVTLQLDFETHGLGKIIGAFARRDAAKSVPRDQARLKELLESGVC